MKKPIYFKDPNFKLAVIQVLMYETEILQPKFDIFEFTQSYEKRDINIDEEGYEIIPEAMDYFLSFSIYPSDIVNITEIYQDGGNDIYMNICPFWSGADDIFNITSADDLVHLQNLKKATLFYCEDDSILKEFNNKGVRANWL